jgi:hypothetical protein
MRTFLLLIALFASRAHANPVPPTPAFGSDAQARALGWDNGNAGDIYTAEFILTARDILPRLKLLPQSEIAEIDLNRLAGAVANTTVHSEEKLELNGYEVDAKNYPDKVPAQIIMSRSRWRTLRTPQETSNRLMLVLHEYLFVIGIDDTQFRLSGRIIPLLDIENFNPNLWRNPLNPANRITTSLEYNPVGCTAPSLDFDLNAASEEVTRSTLGDCGDAFRLISVRKNSFTAPPSSGFRGTFQRYEISVRSAANELLGGFTYEPKWGECVLTQDGTCMLSGKIFVGGVEFLFWLAR